MAHLRVQLFGSLQITLDEIPATGFDSDKVRGLLAYLVVEADRPHRREKLAGLFWPDWPDRAARVNLRRALANLRQVIGDPQADPPFLLITRQTIQFNQASDTWLDVNAFAELANRKTGQFPAIERMEESVALYRGGFLEGFGIADCAEFEEWMLVTRESYQQQVLRLLNRLSGYYEGLEQYEPALKYARRMIELDAYQEEAHRRAMRILALSGQRNEALAQYEACKRILEEELGVKPALETSRLFERIRLGELKGEVVERSVRGYELRELIGEGHFGVVYRGYQPLVGRDVAIKVIRPQYANQVDFIRRFDAEAQMIARLEHPYIVPLYDYWREPNCAYLAMRWLRGGSVEDALKRGPWKIEAATRLVSQISAALAVAHRQGVIHRDVKPSNILLDEEGNAYLSDFGIATLAGTTKASHVLEGLVPMEEWVASLGYASPEVIAHQDATTLADIYSFGVVLYELLVGRHPFTGVTGKALLEKHRTERLPLVHPEQPLVPTWVDEVIQRATAKEPQERYPDILTLAESFRQASLSAETQPRFFTTAGLDIRNPYKGLRPFQASDAADFFGREALVERLVARLAEEGDFARFLALVGPSGSGKSSVAKAGLIPALRRGALPGSENWFFVELTPGADPLEELEIALLRIAVNPPESLLGQLKEDERGLLRAVRRALPGEGGELVIVIDQFEELFAIVEEEGTREHLLKSIYAAVTDPNSCIRIIITLRADFYDRPLLYPVFAKLFLARMETILPLSAEELERSISCPVERVGVRLEPGLMAVIIADVSEQPGSLPMLQYALTELFERKSQDILTLEAYQASGGVLGALGIRAEELYSSLDQAGKEATRQLFLRLITPGDGNDDARRRVQRNELTEIQITGFPDSAKTVDMVLERFGRYRLLTFDRDPATRAPTVEIAHEALLREWSRLAEWIAINREKMRQHRRLTYAVNEWVEAGEDPGYLLRAARLDLYETWPGAGDLALTPTEQKYIEASLEIKQSNQKEEDLRRKREQSLERRIRFFRTALLVGVPLVVVGGLVLFYLSGWWFASAGPFSQIRRVASWNQGRGVAFNPRTGLLAVSGVDAQPTIRDPRTGEIHLTLRQHKDQVLNISGFTADGTRIATTSLDGSVIVWDTGTGIPVQTIWAGMGELISPALSPEGTLVAATSKSGMVGVWDVASGKEVNNFHSSKSTMGLDFSPDGTLLAVATLDNSVEIWQVPAGIRLLPLSLPETGFTDVVFSPDGNIMATSAFDGTVRLWDASSGDMLAILRGHTGGVFGVNFSPDGSQVASCGEDQTVRVWDIDSGRDILILRGHAGAVYNVAFSPDGTLLASGSEDDYTYVWDISPDSVDR